MHLQFSANQRTPRQLDTPPSSFCLTFSSPPLSDCIFGQSTNSAEGERPLSPDQDGGVE
jgi:hypothetical protein